MTAPPVTVVIPTRDRPELLLRTVQSVREQDYEGPVSIVVVFDGTEPSHELAQQLRDRSVTTLRNRRTPGLAGTRNTGILSATDDFVAFCDDDDVWHPHKLTAQMAAMRAHPEAQLVSCAMTVEYDGKHSDRLAGQTWISHQDLCRSRWAMVHSSSLLFRRDHLIAIGMVDESVPGGQNEDWDLLLRSTRSAPLLMVDEPLVLVLWGRTSFFSAAYEAKIAGLEWMLENHPEIRADARGYARVLGQIAYWQACVEDVQARDTARRALRASPREWRAILALLVSRGLTAPDTPLRLLHRFGRGV